MNLWAHMLAELPATGQRVIARAQRISLPRGCDTATRQLRLRQALCHAATVRAIYALLDPPAQAALQLLRGARGGISPADLEHHYGAVRVWRDLAADPRPRTISEQLLLLGWLLPRPPTPRHPSRYLVPPEVRRWLPYPLDLPITPPPAAPSAHLPALRAAATLLLAGADCPVPLTQAGTLCRASLRAITPRMAPIDDDTSAALLDWLLPLLVALDLLSPHQGRASLTIAGQRFLALPPDQQQAQLRDAWIRSPDPDPWLLRLRVDPRGIDWPLLRRRLCTWAACVPADDPRDMATRYAQLARSFGPLADAHTHGFRAVDRAPWQPRRAAAVLDAALQGPLAWLGLISVVDPFSLTPVAAATPPLPTWERGLGGERHRMRNPPRPAGCRQRRPSRWRWPDTDPPARAAVSASADAGSPLPAPATGSAAGGVPACDPAAAGDRQTARSWRYGAPGVIAVPHAAPHAATLRLLPFACWDTADARVTYYRITATSLARARSQGWSAATCRQLLEAQAGSVPDGWCAALADPPPPMRLVQTAVLLVDAPELLARAGHARSVRRYLDQRIAPGIALVRSEDCAPLTRALARQGIACVREGADAGDDQTRTTIDARTPEPSVCLRSHASASQHRAGTAAQPPDWSPGERAALLLACAFYRQHAPVDAPLLPHTGLEARLRAGLTPALHAAVDTALADLRPSPAEFRPMERPVVAAPLEHTIQTLRAAVAHQHPLELTYDTAGQGALSTRTVRPLALEQRADTWYLRAYCAARQAERTFRVDRIMAIADSGALWAFADCRL